MAEINIERMAQNVAEKAIQELRDNGVFIGRWIPVSERLPDKEGTYLLWGRLADDEDYYCFIGDYDGGCERFGYWEQQFDLNTLGCLGEDFFEYECVIAWMPLPEPYKAESEKKQEPKSPCDSCRYNPPGSGDGKPCTMRPAEATERFKDKLENGYFRKRREV